MSASPAKTAEKFDGISWSMIAPLPTARADITGVVFKDEFLVMGGNLTKVDVYSPSFGQWSASVTYPALSSIRIKPAVLAFELP